MPASEETYRSQPNLHLVFAVTSVAMLLSFVWMIAADHLRPWKEIQRDFQQVERGKLEAQEKEKLNAAASAVIRPRSTRSTPRSRRPRRRATRTRASSARSRPSCRGSKGKSSASIPGSGSRRPSSTASAAFMTA